MDFNAFVNPPAEYRLLPFWIWNGAVEEGELIRQIREMRDKGMGGFCLSVGSGLRTPYLSKVWFDRVQIALNTAAECGLQVWIHDDYRSPGGIGNNQVLLAHPDYIAQQLTFRETVVQGGQQVDMALPWVPVLQAIAVPLRRDRSLWEDAQDIRAYLGANHSAGVFSSVENVYHPHTYMATHPVRRLYWKAPAGRWRVLVFLQEPATSPSFPGVRLDAFNADAVAHLHQLVHQPYVDRAGTLPVKTLMGVVTGESLAPADRLPWSPVLPDYFQARNGYSIASCLPALIGNFGPNTARIRYDFLQTVGEILQKHHREQGAEWCRQRGLLYASTAMAPRNVHRFGASIPGAEGGREKIGADPVQMAHSATVFRRSPGFSASLSAQLGADRVLATCFQQTGWSLTLQDMKNQIDLQALQGANLFAPQSFFYTLDGLRKHAAPPSLFQQNPHWKYFRLLSDYAGRVSYALSQGQPVVDIALLDPVTSLWTHQAHPDRDWAYVGNDGDEEALAGRMISDWAYIIQALQQMQRPFASLDPALLSRVKIADRALHIGQACYPVVIVPPIANLERDAFDCLREFINAGGCVIALGLLPIEDIQEGPSIVDAFCRLTDMEPGRMIRDYTGHEQGVHLVQRGNFYLIRTGGAVAKNRGASMLNTILNEVLPRRVVVETEDKHNALCYHHRTDGDRQVFFFCNTGVAETSANIRIPSAKNSDKIERWDMETGKRTPIAAERVGNDWAFVMPFGRLQSHLIVASEGQATPAETEVVEVLRPELKGAWKVDSEEDNALRLDDFRFQIDLQNRGNKLGWHKAEYDDNRWRDVSPGPVAEHLRGLPGDYLLPVELGEHTAQSRVRLPMVCWYRATFAADAVPAKLALVMDRNAILGDYQLYINGSRLPGNAFRPTFRYDHANLTCAVGRRVVKGRNVLAIRIEMKDLNEGLVDALYLFGRFQVKSWRNRYQRLAASAEKGPLNDLDALGLPYYAGTVAYSRDMVFKTLPETRHFELDLGKNLQDFDDVLEVHINGHTLGVRAWAPYTWMGETAWLKKGKNRIVCRVTNTLGRLLTGLKFQAKGHRLVSARPE